MYCSPALAATIDRAEGDLCRAIAFHAQARHGVGPGLIADVSGGTAVFTKPGSPTNKLIGAGFDGPLDEPALAAVEAHFALHRAPLQVEVSTLATPAVHTQLVARGYVPQGFEQVLGRRLEATVESERDVEVSVATAADISVVAATMATAFANPDATGLGAQTLPSSDVLTEWLTTMMRIDGFRGYVARLDGAVAGAGSLRVSGDVALCCGAGTLPTFRRRGVQRALLRARLADAHAAGCTVAVIVTQPASQSQQNAQREGFALLYARQLLVKPAPTD